MAEKSPTPKQELSLTVDEATIARFERFKRDDPGLYDKLFEENEELAMFVRRRAAELAPDMADREAVAQLALEVIEIAKDQAAVDALKRWFEQDAA